MFHVQNDKENKIKQIIRNQIEPIIIFKKTVTIYKKCNPPK